MRSIGQSGKMCFLAIFLAFCMLAFPSCDIGNGDFVDPNVEEGVKIYDGEKYVLKENVETFLVLGLDKFGDDASEESYNNNKQADFILLVVFDNDEKTCASIHINRDTVVEIDRLDVAGNRMNGYEAQIALAHTEGNGREVSCRNTADAVSRLLGGIKVNHYISLSMDAVSVVNDRVGGVELTLLDDFSDIDPELVKGDTVTLKGEQALTYIRERKDLEDSTNISRMERQRQYMSALHKKFSQAHKEDSDLVADIAAEIANYMVSDRSVNQLQKLASKFEEYEHLGIITPKGESKLVGEHMEFYVNEADMEETVISLFYKKSE